MDLQADMEEKLKAHGLRVTPQRVQIAIRTLAGHDHFTAEELIAWAARRKFRMSRATIYNTLNEFVAAGLLRSFYAASGDHVVFDSNVDPHFHFLDTATNELIDISHETGVVNFAALPGFRVDTAEVLLRGRRLPEG